MLVFIIGIIDITVLLCRITVVQRGVRVQIDHCDPACTLGSCSQLHNNPYTAFFTYAHSCCTTIRRVSPPAAAQRDLGVLPLAVFLVLFIAVAALHWSSAEDSESPADKLRVPCWATRRLHTKIAWRECDVNTGIREAHCATAHCSRARDQRRTQRTHHTFRVHDGSNRQRRFSVRVEKMLFVRSVRSSGLSLVPSAHWCRTKHTSHWTTNWTSRAIGVVGFVVVGSISQGQSFQSESILPGPTHLPMSDKSSVVWGMKWGHSARSTLQSVH